MATSQKGTAKKGTGKGASTKKKTTQSKKPDGRQKTNLTKKNTSQSQVGAIALFAVAILLLAIAFIPGASAWAAIRSFFFGCFGVCFYIIPFILGYVAFMTSKYKEFHLLKSQVVEAIILILLLCSAIFVGFADKDMIGHYGEAIKDAFFTDQIARSGGVFGAVFGGAVLVMTGTKIPAMLILLVLIFVVIMIMTGTTLNHLADNIAKPVKKVSTATNEHFEERARINEERQVMRAQKAAAKRPKNYAFNPDVDLGPEFGGTVAAPAPAPVKKAPAKKKPAAKVPEEPILPPTSEKKMPAIEELAKKAVSAKTPQPKIEEDVAKKAEEELEKATQAVTDTSEYRLPPMSLLTPPKLSLGGSSEEELKENAEKLVEVLRSFGVETTIVDISRGPSVTRYELAPAVGVKISKITGLADDIALNLAATSIRIEAPIPGKAAVGIEIPNSSRESVTLREILESTVYKKGAEKSLLSVALGKDISGNTCVTDIAKMPHLLVAGTTGSGKSVCLNAMILSILFNAKPDEVKLIMIDPKKVEFSVYNGLPHLMVPVVSEPSKAAGSLAWAVKEMLGRYKTFSDNNVRDIKGYNELAAMDPDKQKMPHIVIFIDELADLMMATPKEVEDSICRLAQMARAAGMHLVIATQRPSVDVITGLIKANIPSRLSLSVSSAVDSRTILDMAGAEKLLGNGDMLFNPIGNSKPTRIQGCFSSDAEVEKVVEFIKKQGKVIYSEDVIKEIDAAAASAEAGKNKGSGGVADPSDSGAGDGDLLLNDAIRVIVESGQASASLFQRKLKVGYARAGRIMDELEERGYVGPYEGSKPRRVLITKEQWLERNAMSGQDDDGTAAAIDMGVEDYSSDAEEIPF